MGEAKRRAWAARPRLRVTEPTAAEAALVAEIRKLERDAPAAAPEAELEPPEDWIFVGIVKLQRPLNIPAAPWLAYAVDGRRRWFIQPPPRIRTAMGTDPKGYFLAWETGDGELELRSRIRDQPW